MSSTQKQAGSTIGRAALVATAVLTVLKLTGVVTWSWLVVCLPVIISTGLAVLGVVLACVILLVAFVAGAFKD